MDIGSVLQGSQNTRNKQTRQRAKSGGRLQGSGRRKSRQTSNQLSVSPSSPSSSQLLGGGVNPQQTRNPQQAQGAQDLQPTRDPQRNNFNPQPNPRLTARNDSGSGQTSGTSGDGDGGAGGADGSGGGLSAGEQRQQEAEQAYWEDQISQLERLLESAKTQKGQSIDRLGRSFDRGRARLNEDQSRLLSEIETSRQDTITDKQDTLNDVNQQARSTFGNLQQILGAAGSGNSSASEVLAPHAIAQESSARRGDVVDEFGRNLRNLETKEDKTQSQFERNLEDLRASRREKKENLLREFLQEQADLNQQLSRAATQREMAGGADFLEAQDARQPFRNRVSEQMDALDNLFNRFRSPEVTPQPIDVQVPDMGNFAVDPIQLTPGQRGNAPAGTLPFLPFLEEEENRLGA